MEEYKFTVVKSHSDDMEKSSERSLLVRTQILTTQIEFLIKLTIEDDTKFKLEISISQGNHDYLSGLFVLNDSKTLSTALKQLEYRINEKLPENDTYYSSKWEKFARQFNNWFSNDLKPKLLQQYEVGQEIFKSEVL